MPAAGFSNVNGTPSTSTFFVSGPTAGSSIFDSSIFKSKSKRAAIAAAASQSTSQPQPDHSVRTSSSSSVATIDQEKARAQAAVAASKPPRKMDLWTVATRGYDHRQFPKVKYI